MWNHRKCAAMAIAGAGLAVVAATPASACVDWGYSGVYSYGWPYATAGVSSYPSYHYRNCGGSYNIPGWGECGGYGRCGWAPIPAVVMDVPVSAATAPGEATPRVTGVAIRSGQIFRRKPASSAQHR